MRRLSRRAATLLGLLLGGALFLLTRATWMHADVADLVGGRTAVEVSGGQAAPVVVATSVVAMAASAVAAISSRAVRWVSGPLLVVSGAAAVAGSLAVAADPAGSARGPVAAATGLTGSEAVVTGSIWPLLAAVPAVALAILGIGVLVAGRSWSVRTRFDRDAAATPPASVPAADARQDPAAAWDALTRGDDPTAPSAR